MPVGVILSVGGPRHVASASASAAGAHEKDAGVTPSSVQARRSLFKSQQDGSLSCSPHVGKERNSVAAVTASTTRSEPVRPLRTTPRRLGGGGGGASGYGGSRSWYFGTDISSAPEGTIAIRLPISSSPFAASSSASDSTPAAHGAVRITAVHQPVLTPERRAQATVWDHMRFEGRGEIGPDPGLVAEAHRLMMSDAGDIDTATEIGEGEDGKRKKKLCFSSNPETFEYQSEMSRIEELGITPDYPLGSFEVADPTVRAAAHRIDAAPPFKRDLSPLPAGNSEIATYKAKLSIDSFAWGVRVDRPDSGQNQTSEPAMVATTNSSLFSGSLNDEFNSKQSRREYSESQQPSSPHQQQQQWSMSTTADLLF